MGKICFHEIADEIIRLYEKMAPCIEKTFKKYSIDEIRLNNSMEFSEDIIRFYGCFYTTSFHRNMLNEWPYPYMEDYFLTSGIHAIFIIKKHYGCIENAICKIRDNGKKGLIDFLKLIKDEAVNSAKRMVFELIYAKHRDKNNPALFYQTIIKDFILSNTEIIPKALKKNINANSFCLNYSNEFPLKEILFEAIEIYHKQENQTK